MERKIEVYKDSKGKLYEDRDKYYVAELEIIHQKNIELFEYWLDIVRLEPENYYKLLRTLLKSDKINDEIDEKKFNEHMNFIKEAKKIKSEMMMRNEYPDYESNSNWNSNPGDWLGISAQDLGVPNC